MSSTKKNAAERIFQDDFVKELQKYRWEAPDELNGNLTRVTVETLIENWRDELNRINQDQLEGIPLTDNEFEIVMSKVKAISNSFQAAQMLSMEGSKGKIDGISRDKDLNVTRKQITLTIFEKSSVSGGASKYQIAREVVSPARSGKEENRFDIILLINGLPLINIEQKRTDKSLDEAFGQFQRYYRDGEYQNNFLAFSQMMVMTSEVATRYFATPKLINDFNKAFVFNWSDRNNTPMNYWRDIVEHFLMIPMAHQMVGDYLVIDEAEFEENRRHMLMRPYQVYALQAIENAAFGANQELGPHGGYIWHTTGSGKTITSFKTALHLSTRGGFDKIVFLVDRRELDNRTSENFKAYAAYESVSVDSTPHTYHLKNQLHMQGSGIVVTTTFKLHNLVKALIEDKDYSLAEKKMVFIIDEAHRTTMGQMMGMVKAYFKVNSLFYGFTGTPLFDENQASGKINEKSEVIDTTEKLFGPLLHRYTIGQAIRDENVLGFNVDYINTGEFESYQSLADEIIEQIIEEKPQSNSKEVQRDILQLNEAELEIEALNRNLLIYQDENHIPKVVAEILANWETQSDGRHFNAILTVAYKKRVTAYYKEFKRQLENSENPINIAMTISFGNENDPDNVSYEVMDEMFKDYSQFTGIEFLSGDKIHGEDAYFEDLIARATRGGSGRNPKNIDLVIVADQLLTGYDSKLLNTLYVDRNLELHSLIQAYSRTNRVYGKSKEFGTIVNFQYPALTKEAVKRALTLYGGGGTSEQVIVEPYEEAVAQLQESVLDLQEIFPDPTEWQNLQEDSEKLDQFNLCFRDAKEKLSTVQQYYQYEWNENDFGIDEHQWLRYEGAYQNLKDDNNFEEEEIPLRSIGRTRLQNSQIIDANFILRLAGEQTHDIDGYQHIDGDPREKIEKYIEELSQLGKHNEALMLRQFLEEKLYSHQIPTEVSLDDAYASWKEDQLKLEIVNYSNEIGVDQNVLKESYQDYDDKNSEHIPFYKELSDSLDDSGLVGLDLMRRRATLSDQLRPWFRKTKEKFDH